jgi:hypothetical protein
MSCVLAGPAPPPHTPSIFFLFKRPCHEIFHLVSFNNYLSRHSQSEEDISVVCSMFHGIFPNSYIYILNCNSNYLNFDVVCQNVTKHVLVKLFVAILPVPDHLHVYETITSKARTQLPLLFKF